MASVELLLREGVERLRASGSPSPRLDAELLLALAIGVDRTALLAHPEAPVGADAADAYELGLERRTRGEPVAYIRGLKEFHGIAFAVDHRALIPRPETELIVDLALAELTHRLTAAPRSPGTPPIRVVDIGTGCGAIAIALASALRRSGAVDDVELLATDVSEPALDLARENAVAHGIADRLAFAHADLVPPNQDRSFDLVLANLPYVPTDVVPQLPVAASFEPPAALDGGPDGLRVIERLLEQLPGLLAAGGVAMLEIGADQAPALGALIERLLPGWAWVVEPDLAGDPRVVRIHRDAAEPGGRSHG